jgi:hypothetical protein
MPLERSVNMEKVSFGTRLGWLSGQDRGAAIPTACAGIRMLAQLESSASSGITIDTSLSAFYPHPGRRHGDFAGKPGQRPDKARFQCAAIEKPSQSGPGLPLGAHLSSPSRNKRTVRPDLSSKELQKIRL